MHANGASRCRRRPCGRPSARRPERRGERRQGRSPDVVNLAVLPHLSQGAMLADVVALIGTIDVVLGLVDR